MKIAGLDIGTTGCKIVVYDETGNILGKEYCDYPVTRSKYAHEMDVNGLTQGVFTVIKNASGRFGKIDGIGVTSFGESFVLVGKDDKPLLPVMLYTDSRGREECDELVAKLGREEIIRITGVAPHEMYSLPKLMWVKKHKPEVYKDVFHVLLVQDYVVYLLTKKRQIDYSLATRTLAFDINNLCWSEKIFSAAGIDFSLFSNPVASGTVAGCVTKEIADFTGLSVDTKIVSVSHDQLACAVGSGVFDADTAVDGAGTVECITPVFDKIPTGTLFQDNNYNVVPYFDKYICYAYSYTGGALLKWCLDCICKKEKEIAESLGQSVYTMLQSGYTEPTGLLVLPHFAGAATPYMDMGSKGAIIGLTAGTTANEIFNACMEGVVYEMRLNIERMAQSGITVKKLIATGGGAKSEVWMQMKADILGVPLITLSTEEAGSIGSAMFTGVAVGAFSDLSDAQNKMVRKTKEFVPNSDRKKIYDKIYERYTKLYEAVRPLV